MTVRGSPYSRIISEFQADPQKDIKAKIAALTCVHFEVTENAENLLHNSLAAWQSPQDTSLWLDDFGSGYAGINAIRGYHFDGDAANLLI